MADMKLSTTIDALIQDDSLDPMIHEALNSRPSFDAVADPEEFPGRVGETRTKTREGLYTPVTEPIAVGTDPNPSTNSVEQWTVRPQKYAGSARTDLVGSYLQVRNQWMKDNNNLLTQAAESRDRIARKKIYNSYAGGATYATAAGPSVSLPVATLAGFSYVLDSDGVEQAVSATNPLEILIDSAGAAVTAYVTAVSATDPLLPSQAGTLTVTTTTGAAIAVAFSQWDDVVAVNAPQIIRAGDRLSTYGVLTDDVFTTDDVDEAVMRLDNMSVPRFPGDVFYCFLDPVSRKQFASSLKGSGITILQAQMEDVLIQKGVIGEYNGVVFFAHNNLPRSGWVGSSEDFGPVLRGTNGTGAVIHRPIVFGAGMLTKDYLDPEKIGQQVDGESATASRIRVVDNVKWVYRGPLDKSAEIVDTSWVIYQDYGVPSDITANHEVDPARFKRAVVIEHGAAN